MTTEPVDALIVGAGPAGMSAAITFARHSGNCLVVDEQPAPGGQIYRGAEKTGKQAVKLFGSTYRRGAELIAEFRKSGCDYLFQSTVMNVDANLNADVLTGGRMKRIRAKTLIFATGAYERPVPLEGWTLPGVLTAGAAQVMAKQSGVVPKGRVVLVGNGPLLWLLAWQLRRMGVDLSGIVEMDSNRRPAGAWAKAPGFLVSHYARDGLKYLLDARMHTRIARPRGRVWIEGPDGALCVKYEAGKGRIKTIEADHVLLHDGVIPNVHLSGAAGCVLKWSVTQRAWRPQVDQWQQAAGRPGIYIAGDGAGIQGAGAAEATGAFAALDALYQTGRLSEPQRDAAAMEWRTVHKRHLKGRRFIDKWFAPVETVRFATEDTLVCRCEAVTRQQAETAIRQQPGRLAHLKSTTRCGMGPCQGRMCMPSIGSLARSQLGVHPTCIGPPSFRFPVKPLAVPALAAFEGAGEPEAGPVRE